MTEKTLLHDLIRDVGIKSSGDDLHGMDCMSHLTSNGVTGRKVVSDSPSCILSAFIGAGVHPNLIQLNGTKTTINKFHTVPLQLVNLIT